MLARDGYRAGHMRGSDDGAEVGGAHGVLQATCASNEARRDKATRDKRGKDKEGRVHKKGQAVEGLASKVHLAKAPSCHCRPKKAMFANCLPQRSMGQTCCNKLPAPSATQSLKPIWLPPTHSRHLVLVNEKAARVGAHQKRED